MIWVRGLEPHDLWPIIGSKSRVSDILSGKRAISKAHAKKLAAFFRVPIDLLI
jgi:antitoxin component HigA of HigAB toxin-antitoxin module